MAQQKFDLTALLGEMGTLTFARVTKMVYNEKHVLRGERGEKVYSHFCGFSRCQSKSERSVWFKKESHLPQVYVGPAIHAAPLSKLSEYPRAGDTIVGLAAKAPKGEVFVWWTHGARPLLEFIKMLQEVPTRVLRQSSRTYSRLGGDDLYVFCRLVLGDVRTLALQLTEGEKQRHPVHKDETGYQRQKGFRLRCHPVCFAYYSALMCRSPAMYEAFLAQVPCAENADVYTVERLKQVLNQ
tara:strand:+ start:1611 stop:2330 length:720 start_codon:yes stop_codon:yes gene_type:complete